MRRLALLIWHYESSLWIGFHGQGLPQWGSPGAANDSQEVPIYQRVPWTDKILERIDQWIEAKRWTTKLFWLHGPESEGTSAIAQTVAETCAERGKSVEDDFGGWPDRGVHVAIS